MTLVLHNQGVPHTSYAVHEILLSPYYLKQNNIILIVKGKAS